MKEAGVLEAGASFVLEESRKVSNLSLSTHFQASQIGDVHLRETCLSKCGWLSIVQHLVLDSYLTVAIIKPRRPPRRMNCIPNLLHSPTRLPLSFLISSPITSILITHILP